MSVVNVKEMPGIVVISGIFSPESALHLCEQFNNWGVKTTIGKVAGTAGYQLFVHRLSIDRVKAILRQLGVDTD